MKYFIPLAMILCLMGCNTPSPKFRGIDPTRVTVDGSTFDVRVRDNTAEALRVNAEYAPRFGPIRERASKAMALVSGCEVKTVTGDQALAFGRLKCGKNTAPHYQPEPKEVTLECIPQRGSEISGINQVTVDLDCY